MPGGSRIGVLLAAAPLVALAVVLWWSPAGSSPDPGSQRADDPASPSASGLASRSPAPAPPPGSEARGGFVREPPAGERSTDETVVSAGLAETSGGRAFSIAGSGDLLIHAPLYRAAETGDPSGPAYDFTPMFTQVTPVIDEVDLAICHLEVPLSEDNTDLSGYPLFMGPRELAADIAEVGFNACSVASNHSVDQGRAGVSSTLDALDAAGVGHAGTARSADEAVEPALYQVGDVIVGHLSYTYGLNGLPLPEPWMVNLLDADAILAEAAEALDAGAEFVVASLHWGLEYQREPTDEQREIAERLLGDGAVDLILGHHAHVVQPIERIDGRVVAYGLGNFLSNQSAACCLPETQDGVIVVVDVEETAPGAFEAVSVQAVPTWVDRDDGYEIVDVVSALDRDDLPQGRRDTLETSRDRTESALASGHDDDPAVIVGGTEVYADNADRGRRPTPGIGPDRRDERQEPQDRHPASPFVFR